MHAMRVAARTVAVELLLPFHHIAVAAVLRDQLVHLIAALACAFGAFDAQHIELAFDVAEDEVNRAALDYRRKSFRSCDIRHRRACANQLIIPLRGALPPCPRLVDPSNPAFAQRGSFFAVKNPSVVVIFVTD